MGSMEKTVDSLRVKWPRRLGLRRGFGPIGKGSLTRGGNEVFGGRGMEERHVVQTARKWRTSVRVSMHFAIFSSRSRLRPDHWGEFVVGGGDGGCSISIFSHSRVFVFVLKFEAL